MRSRRTLCVMLLVGLIAACAPVERTERMPGNFAWFELVTPSPETAAAFYKTTFGWSMSRPDDGIRTISNKGQFVGNLISDDLSEGSPIRAQWLPVLTVADTGAELGRIRHLGGKTLNHVENFALIRDSSGAELVLYDGEGGVPTGQDTRVGDWIWTDLFTSRVSAARGFYKALAGFDTRKVKSSDGDVFEVFQSGGADRGGLVYAKSSQIEPNWLPYVLVSDVDATLNKATSAGARVLEQDGSVAILIDPVGAAIGIADRTALE